MNDRQILASPNWYSSGISDTSVDGLYAFGGKNTIFLLDLTAVHECCQYFGQLCGHKDRVTSVNFCKTSAYSRCIVSSAEDLSVIIWDVDAKASISKHNGHQAKITTVYWSSVSHEWIFSGDEKGHIFSWNHQQNEVYKHIPLAGHINCMSCSPDEEGLMVVGYKTGQILVLLLQREKQEIVHVLKGHNDEVHSLVWSPVPASELPAEIFGVPKYQESGNILASGSRDKTIRLWDITVGQFTVVLHVPNRTSNKKTSREDYHIKSRLWNTLCWPQTDPNSLISSGFNGDILAWNLSKNSKQKWKLFNEGSHSRIVFNICHYAANDVMVSVSMDRVINIWNRHDATVITSLPSCGGFVYSLDVSVLDPSRLAIGSGDNMIHIWETMTQGASYDVTCFWRGIGTKVMKVLWHPIKEGLLAFGTEEGKVGIYNVMSQACNVSRTYHKKSVYSLSWGPPSGSSGDEDEDGMIWHLYSCGGEGTIFEHKPSHLHEVAKNVDQLIKTTNDSKHNLAGHSEVSWNPGRSLMAVGNEDGSIKFYRFPDLKLLATVNVHNKSITCLSWYRAHNPTDLGSTFLASGSNGSEIHVHDVKHITDGVDKKEQKVFTSSYRWLSGHGGRVTNVVWSPHSFSQIASSSYDGTVEVWDVLKGEPLVNYRGHTGRVMTVAWSLLDPDVLFSGGDDFTVRSWKMSQQVFKQPPVEVKKITRPKSKKKKKKASGTNEKTDSLAVEPSGSLVEENEIVRDEREPIQPDVEEETQHPAKLRSSESTDTLQGSSFHLVSSATEKYDSVIRHSVGLAGEPSVGTKVEPKKKKKKGKSLFPLAASADNKPRSITSQECVAVAKLLVNIEGSSDDILHIPGENINLGLFAHRKSAFHMFSEEGIHHAETGNMDYQMQLEVWKGNVGKALELAVEKKQLSDWLVAMSHLAGEQVRLAVTEAFAEQLVSQGSYHRAALYYLACHKVYEAIRMFKTSGMYREAISLAKVRLLPSDPLLLDLYSSWGRKLEGDHSYELASKCYLACGLHEDAIRVLTRRGDEIALHSAAQIAKLCKKIELSESLILQCAIMAVKKAKWNDALEMVHDYPDMQPFLMLMFVHKTIVVSLLKSGAIVSGDFPEIQDSDDSGNLDVMSDLPIFISQLKAQYETRSSGSASFWGSNVVDDSYSVCKILERWWIHCGLHENEAKLHGVFVQIAALGCNQNFSNKDDIGNIFIIISKNICLGLVAALLAKTDICMDYFLKAVVHCHDCGYSKILCHVVELLFPFGLESWYMVKCLIESHRESTGDQYFCNIMAFYYRALLTKTLASQKLKMKLRHDLQESRQILLSKDAVECSTSNTMEPCNTHYSLDMNDAAANEEQISENAVPLHISDAFSQEIPNIQSVSELDFGSTENHAEEEDKEVYRIAVVCSTVLLSDIYAQYQKVNGNIKTCVPEEGEYAQNGSPTERTEMEMSLSKIPFPNVMESASILVDLLNCIVLSKETHEVDKVIALKLSSQVRHWAAARGCELETGEF